MFVKWGQKCCLPQTTDDDMALTLDLGATECGWGRPPLELLHPDCAAAVEDPADQSEFGAEPYAPDSIRPRPDWLIRDEVPWPPRTRDIDNEFYVAPAPSSIPS